jgi:sugar/nucleoside kinase (ribokinase family)
MLEYIVYGKIIIDKIRLRDGTIVDGILGGGGPQGAFGARLWSKSVGFLSRSGTDIEPGAEQALRNLDIDLSGWVQYPDIPTAHGVMFYDENEYMKSDVRAEAEMKALHNNLQRTLARPLTLPESYQNPKVIHLITEYSHEKMVHDALRLRDKGAIFSLEPIIDYRRWTNRESILELLPEVEIATPDWPSASGFAGTDDPLEVMRYWAGLGPKLIAVRHGHHGSYIWGRDRNEFWHIPPVPVIVEDPTGAGNCYGGGLMVGWDKTRDALTAGCYGAISASFLVRCYGLPAMTQALEEEARSLLEPTLASAERMA